MIRRIRSIVEAAEQAKKKGDISFARNDFQAAVDCYKEAIEALTPLRGAPEGEILAIQSLSNQAQCYSKLGKYDSALSAINLALSIPSASFEEHLLSKLYLRKSVALKELGKIEEALNSADRSISIDGFNSEILESMRSDLIDEITEKHGVVPIPPRPEMLAPTEITGIIGAIFKLLGDPIALSPIFDSFIHRNSWLDRRDNQKNNIMWALCQVAMALAGKNDNPDKISPLLEMMYQNGARAEQRFPQSSFRTPLQCFAMAGAVNCVFLTLKHGASPHTYDDEGWTPLLVACSPNRPSSSSNSSVVKLLISAKSNVNHQNRNGMSPLASASQGGDEETVNILIESGSTLNIRCSLGFSPIVWAKLGNSPHSNAIQAHLLEAAQLQGGDALVFELSQDSRCFDFSKVVLSLKQMKIRTHGGEEYIDILRALFGMKKHIPADAEIVNTEQILQYEKLYTSIMGLVPYVARKRWAEKDSSLSTEEIIALSVSRSSKLEQYWLNVLYLAISGPPAQGQPPPPPIRTNEFVDFYYLCMWDDFRDVLQEPLQKYFGYFLPIEQGLSKLSHGWKTSMITKILYLTCEDNEKDEKPESSNYWIKCLSQACNKHEVDCIVSCQSLKISPSLSDINGSLSSAFAALNLSDNNSSSIFLNLYDFFVHSDFFSVLNRANEEDRASFINGFPSAILNGYQGSSFYFVGYHHPIASNPMSEVVDANVELSNNKSESENNTCFSFLEVVLNRLSLSLVSHCLNDSSRFQIDLVDEIPAWLWSKHSIYHVQIDNAKN